MDYQQPILRLFLFSGGYCMHPEWVTLRGGSWRSVAFPAGFACILHPSEGAILFDTGYTERFFTETAKLPAALYRYITPVRYEPQDSAKAQLEAIGITPDQVKLIVLSHMHADHVAGVRDFPHVRIMCMKSAWDSVATLSSLRAVKAGFLPGLLPADFLKRVQFVEAFAERLTLPSPLGEGYDLLGDRSLIAVDLSGHAAGMFGVLVRTSGHTYLLGADASWSLRALTENRPPHPLAALIMYDKKAYAYSFDLLRQLQREQPNLRIVPSHCQQTLTCYGGEAP